MKHQIDFKFLHQMGNICRNIYKQELGQFLLIKIQRPIFSVSALYLLTVIKSFPTNKAKNGFLAHNKAKKLQILPVDLF